MKRLTYPGFIVYILVTLGLLCSQAGASSEQIDRSISHEHLFPEEVLLQGQSGACQSFGAANLISALVFKETGKKVHLSPMDIFYRLYFTSTYQGWEGDIDNPSKEEAIFALIHKSRYSRTAEAATYDNALKLALKGVASMESVPLMTEEEFRDLAQVRGIVLESFLHIRSQVKSENKSIQTVEKEQRQYLYDWFDTSPAFHRLYDGNKRGQSVLEERAFISEALHEYKFINVSMVR